MAISTNDKNLWEVLISQPGQQTTLLTQNKYLDRDIVVKADLNVKTNTDASVNGVYSEGSENGIVKDKFTVTVNIPAGWYDGSSIVKTFENVLKDIDDDALNSHILTGFKAYNEDGILIEGSMPEFGAYSDSKVLDTTTTSYTFTSGAGHYDSVSVTASIVTQTKTATPTETSQTVSADTGKVLSQVTVNAIPATYVGSGVAKNSSANLSVDGPTVTVPVGYYGAEASATVGSGSATVSGSIPVSMTIGAAAGGEYPITLSGSKSLTPTATTGYVTQANMVAGTVSASGSDALTQSTINKTTVTPTTSSQTVTVSSGYYHEDRTITIEAATGSSIDSGVLTANDTDVTVEGNGITVTKVASKPANGVYVTSTGVGGAKVTTAGFLEEGAESNDTTTVYYTLPTTTVSGSVSDATANITSLSPVYNSASGLFDVDATGTISGTVVPSGDLNKVITAKNNGTVSGTATVDATLPKIVLGINESGSKTVKPVIAKTNVAAGVTDASDGAATSTAPADGVYVAVQSGAKTTSLTHTPKVTTAGYGTTSAFGAGAEHTDSVGADASDVTYVKIKEGSASIDDTEVTANISAILGNEVTASTANLNTVQINLLASGQNDVSGTVSEIGWISAIANGMVLVNGTKTLTLEDLGIPTFGGETASPEDGGNTETWIDQTGDLGEGTASHTSKSSGAAVFGVDMHGEWNDSSKITLIKDVPLNDSYKLKTASVQYSIKNNDTFSKPVYVAVAGSNDGTNWTGLGLELFNIPGSTTKSGTATISLNSTTPYSYVRYYVGPGVKHNTSLTGKITSWQQLRGNDA